MRPRTATSTATPAAAGAEIRTIPRNQVTRAKARQITRTVHRSPARRVTRTVARNPARQAGDSRKRAADHQPLAEAAAEAGDPGRRALGVRRAWAVVVAGAVAVAREAVVVDKTQCSRKGSSTARRLAEESYSRSMEVSMSVKIRRIAIVNTLILL